MDSESNISGVLFEWSVAYFRRSLAEFNQFVRNSGLSMPQMTVLTRLYHHGPCEINQLKELLKTSKAGTGQLVDRMEQQGLITRSISKTDRRVRIVMLTDKGNDLIKAGIDARENWMKEILDRVPPDEVDGVVKALHTLTHVALSIDPGADGDKEMPFIQAHMM